MSKIDRIPEHWTVEVDEIAMSVYRVLATANDGRRIEMTGSNEAEMYTKVLDSISNSDTQIVQLMQVKGNQ